MNQQTTRVTLFAVLCWSVFQPVAAQEGPDPRPTLARIVVQPSNVYVGSRVRLSIESTNSLQPIAKDTKLKWSASVGTVLIDDSTTIEWRAPATPGTAIISVHSTDDARARLQGEVAVTVKRPSTDGMVWIPSGEFTQGDILGTQNTKELKTFQNSSDEPHRRVFVDGFWIDQYPVTNTQFRDFLRQALKEKLIRVNELAVWGDFEGSWVPFYYFRSYEELVSDYLVSVNARTPEFEQVLSWNAERRDFDIRKGDTRASVVDVSWFGAAAYARFYGRRLPTESQWEKAARGTDQRRFPWGDHPPTAYHGNLNYTEGYSPIAVGSYRPYSDSPYGVSDLVAGLFEWTGDWFNGYYYRDNQSKRAQRNPQGTFWGSAHAIRGAPYTLNHPSVRNDEAVSFRYHWRFEFFIGDLFANRQTTFRTAYSPKPTQLRYEDPL
ncbi:MAG: formylglycine-generating enzyme family protein [Planctomycetes bacterium]|nr:formylglycine-generating enzyme family protein [Planctomycetota bacterium]